MIDVTDLHKWFGDHHVLRGITLHVDRGDVLVIIGPSGSGKTTLLRCLNRLEEYDKGTIHIEGRTSGLPPRYPSDPCRNRVRLPEDQPVSHMTALENLIEAPMLVRKRSRVEAETPSP